MLLIQDVLICQIGKDNLRLGFLQIGGPDNLIPAKQLLPGYLNYLFIFILRGLAPLNEAFREFAVFARVVQEKCKCFLPVAACPADFLVIVYGRLGYLSVDYKTYVWFINTHSQCICRDNGIVFIVHEVSLDTSPCICVEAGTVGSRVKLEELKPVGVYLCVCLGSGINDSRLREARQILSQPEKLFILAVYMNNKEAEIRAKQLSPDRDQVRSGLFYDISLHAGCCRCGGSEHREVFRQQPDEVHNAAIVRSEALSPHRDAMGLINHHHCNFHFAGCAYPPGIFHSLWGDIKNIKLVLPGCCYDFVILFPFLV